MPGEKEALIAMDVVGVRVELPSNQPIVLLMEADGQRYLPIWIGGSEATASGAAGSTGDAPSGLSGPVGGDLRRNIVDGPQKAGWMTAGGKLSGHG